MVFCDLLKRCWWPPTRGLKRSPLESPGGYLLLTGEDVTLEFSGVDMSVEVMVRNPSWIPRQKILDLGPWNKPGKWIFKVTGQHPTANNFFSNASLSFFELYMCETNGIMSGSYWLFPQLFPLRKLRWKSVGRSQSTRSLPRSGRLAGCWISLKDCWVGFQTFEALLPSVPAYTKHGFLWWFRWFMSKSFGPGASCFQAAWASGWEFSVEWED